MLTDRYGLALSTTVAAAQEAYIEGVDLLLTVYPGAASSFDRAIAADPGFALPHIGKARAFQLAGNLAAMREALASHYPSVTGVRRENSAISMSFVTCLPARPSRRWPRSAPMWRRGRATHWC